jgi:putative endonuclease
MNWRKLLGQSGEAAGEKYLRRKGYRIVARNYHCKAGEIDLVALDGPVIVFVEVKTRSDDDVAAPQDAVNRGKRRHLINAARHFLRRTRSEHRPARFDILAIVQPPEGPARIEHFDHAFTAS